MRLLLLIAIALAAAHVAHAEPAALARAEAPRVLTAPTAWLPAEGALTATLGFDPSAFARAKRHGDGSLVVGYGLGRIASVELGTDTDVRGCTECDAEAGPAAIWLGRAAFRIGAPEDALFRGMPAMLLGVRTTFATFNTRQQARAFARPRVSEAYVVTSRRLGPVRLHGGASLLAAGFDPPDDELPPPSTLGPALRPLAGLEWTPAIYPRTTLLADFAYSVRFERAAPALEWIAGWGVRYQALRWSSLELAVRHREDEGLRSSTVLVRINASTR